MYTCNVHVTGVHETKAWVSETITGPGKVPFCLLILDLLSK